jgi:hypothetical protein
VLRPETARVVVDPEPIGVWGADRAPTRLWEMDVQDRSGCRIGRLRYEVDSGDLLYADASETRATRPLQAVSSQEYSTVAASWLEDLGLARDLERWRIEAVFENSLCGSVRVFFRCGERGWLVDLNPATLGFRRVYSSRLNSYRVARIEMLKRSTSSRRAMLRPVRTAATTLRQTEIFHPGAVSVRRQPR